MFLTLFRPAAGTIEGHNYPLGQIIQIAFELWRVGGTRPGFRLQKRSNRVSSIYANISLMYYCRICEGLAYGSQTLSKRRQLLDALPRNG